MNKKADGKIISVYWFVVLVVVAGGVFLMVNMYYNSPYDVREVEAELLAEKVADCIYFKGKLNPDLISNTGVFKEEFIDHLSDRCSLNLDPVGQWVKPQYYIEVDFYDFVDKRNVILNMSEGNLNWKPDCDLKEEKYGNLVVCVEKEFYAKGIAKDIYLIKVLTIVRKTEQNVK